MFHKITWGFISSIALIFSACEIINPGETVPTYVSIQDYEIAVEPDQGTADQKLSSYWIYLDNNLQGVYPNPSQFPLLIEEEGAHLLVVGAGVELNGIASDNSEYFVLDRDSFIVEKNPGGVLEITPEFAYRENTTFVFLEDFESGVELALDVDGDDTTNLTQVADTVFEGQFAGRLFVDTAHRVMEVASLNSYALPKTGTPVYIELNYRNDVEFQVGLLAFDTETGRTDKIYKVRLRTRDEWNKVYVSVREEVAQLDADRFGLLIGAGLPANSEQTSGSIYIDNIKFVYR